MGLFKRSVLLPVMASVALVGAVVLSAPATAQTVGDAQTVPAAAAAPPKPYDYVLGSGDVLRIIVFGEATLTGEFTVAGNGILSFPLIGDVQASGKTVEEVRDEITAGLQDGYIKDPKVSAEVLTFRPYFILGEVQKPGEYPYRDRITVMNAIATAGGFTYRANQSYVFVKPSDGSTERKERLNDLLSVAPGDTIRIAERFF
jgi:polysaccharide biosynthesis/export protein VpsN